MKARKMVGIFAAFTAACLIGAPRLEGASAPCRLGNGAGDIKHVIYIQFDNVHLTRDNPNVPSSHRTWSRCRVC